MALSSTGIRFDGLASGIDYQSIIDQLLTLQRRPILKLNDQIKKATDQKGAYLDLSSLVLTAQGTAAVLGRGVFFDSTKVSSSNEGILLASGSTVQSSGSFTFRVAQTARAHQVLSQGYADSSAALGGGTVTLETGGGYVNRRTPLSALNGGAGVDRGVIRITDQSGGQALVDLSGAVTVADAVEGINDAIGTAVEAELVGDRIAIRDLSGGAGTLRIQSTSGNTTAEDLGIAGSLAAASGTVLYGENRNTMAVTTALTQLNDGNGVRQKGSDLAPLTDIRVSLRDGSSVDVDIPADATTLQGVLDAFNTALGANGQMSLDAAGQRLVLDDFTAGAGATALAALNNSNAIVDLGLDGMTQENRATGLLDAVNGDRVTGRRLIAGPDGSLRDTLNGARRLFDADGSPVADTSGVTDGVVRFQDRAGATVDLDLSRRTSTTLSLAAGAGATTLDLGSAAGIGVGTTIRITDGASTEYRTVVDVSGTQVVLDRGLQTAGGFGAGAAVHTEKDTLADLLTFVNDRAAAAGVGVRLDVGSQGNGLRVSDTTGASAANLEVTDVSGTAGADLGILQSVAASYFYGTDLDPGYINESTVLDDLNGGNGVYAGRFRVTDTQGISFTVDISQATDDTVGRVLQDLNGAASASGSGVRGRINDSGDGILLEDKTPGAGILTVQDLDNGTSAEDLGIVGSAETATPARIDGSYETTLTFDADDSLTDVAKAINDAGLGVTASVFSDGSGAQSYRLSLLSNASGQAGRLVAGGTLGIEFQTATAAQDAVLLYGSSGGGSEPILIQSSSNRVRNVVPGLNLDLVSPSSQEVTVTVSRDTAAITDQVARLVDNINTVLDKVDSLNSFDPDTFTTGVLFGESTVQNIERELYLSVTTPVDGISTSKLNTLSEIGVKVLENGKLFLDRGALDEALSSKFEEVEDLFTRRRPLAPETLLKDFRNGLGVGTVSGADFRIERRDGVTFDVDLSGASAVSGVLSAINNHVDNTGGLLQASISADGRRIVLNDLTGGGGDLSVTAKNGSSAAANLGIKATVTGNELEGTLINLLRDPGAGERMADRLALYTNIPDGVFQTKTNGLDSKMDQYRDKIEQINGRVERQEESLVREFSRLEQYLAQSQTLMQQLGVQLNNMIQGFQASKR